jgi:hypothetical protein
LEIVLVTKSAASKGVASASALTAPKIALTCRSSLFYRPAARKLGNRPLGARTGIQLGEGFG